MRKRLTRITPLVYLAVSPLLLWLISAEPGQAPLAGSSPDGKRLSFDLPAIRYIGDPYPVFNGIAVDPEHGEVVISDANQHSVLVYDRLASSSDPQSVTEQKRRIIGPRTQLGYVASVYVDPVTREIYVADHDIGSRVLVFSKDASGNAAPQRVLYEGSWGMSIDRTHDELALARYGGLGISVYRREAKDFEAPLRNIRGSRTELNDPFGIYLDGVHNEIFVATAAASSDFDEQYENPYQERFRPLLPSTGKFVLPSIAVYSRTVDGNVPPLRMIRGARTGLKFPRGLHVDTVHNEIAVADNASNSIVIFGRTAQGDVAPVRSLAGSRTLLDHPIAVHIDAEHNELWAVNFGNHTATVYARDAKGDVAPLRVIRSAPASAPVVGFSNPMALTYDEKRREILVGN